MCKTTSETRYVVADGGALGLLDVVFERTVNAGVVDASEHKNLVVGLLADDTLLSFVH